ncbi:hypothetical protein Hypma_004551 [Hypsizygus marmoreus]|uniref:Uncharacterized protein n=1 Tax=Hypsizygus marmoreus TaxID=39966 RepID=A0A369J073_HYPMA|nr:hypothetical protein Hypma_004551 [Hypsizygus marmoreus]
MSTPPTFKQFHRGGIKTYLASDAKMYCVIPRQVYTLNATSGIANITSQVGAGSDQYWIITTPNANYIPEAVLGRRPVRARKDGRYGLQDRTIHPQYYAASFEYICCIPRHPEDPKDPLQLMWFTPQASDTDLVKGMAFDVNLRKLNEYHLNALRKYRDMCIDLCRQYEKHKGHAELIGLLESTMCHCFNKLASTAMTFKQLTLAVAELQRIMLDIHAIIDYSRLFYPRLFPKPDDRGKVVEVDHTRMGAFTEDVLIAEQLLQMGIPVWLLRPVTTIPPDMNMFEESPMKPPMDMVIEDWGGDQLGDRPFPVIYEGPPGTERLRATQRIGCVFRDLREVSAVGQTRVEGGDGPADVARAAGEDGSSSQTSTMIMPAKPAAKVVKTNAGKKADKASKDHFKDPDDPRMPPGIPAWQEALRNVDRSLSRVDPNSKNRIAFRFPDPRTVLGSSHSSVYIACWLASRAYHMWTVAQEAEFALPSTSQQWRDFLAGVRWLLGPTFFKQLDTMNSVPLNTSLPAKGSGKGKRKRGQNVTEYLAEHPLLSTRPDQIFFHEERIMLGSPEDLEKDLTVT